MPIYLDYAATTPPAPEVREAMAVCMRDNWGNASSRNHSHGRRAAQAVDRARQQIADLLGTRADELTFTSGATESNNLALDGLFSDRTGHLVISATEHPSVIEAARRLSRAGVDVTVLPVGGDGCVDPAAVAEALTTKTRLVSVMCVNNEVGTINPIDQIGQICRERGVLFHSDIVQAVGKVPVDLANVDLASVTAHKMYGPTGVGALYVRRRKPALQLVPALIGGGQQQGLRPGTFNVAGIVGFGVAAQLTASRLDQDIEHYRSLRRVLVQALVQSTAFQLNTDGELCAPSICSVSFPGCDARQLIRQLSDLSVSSGAACASSDGHGGSHVLAAMGLAVERQRSTLRLSFGRPTLADEVRYAAQLVCDAVAGCAST
ncbi:MAG: cysteine desulfurase [Deltaproteobacteria bacterium]|nr:cysteine desulfurase [Deltaproteobacteria bacterium]